MPPRRYGPCSSSSAASSSSRTTSPTANRAAGRPRTSGGPWRLTTSTPPCAKRWPDPPTPTTCSTTPSTASWHRSWGLCNTVQETTQSFWRWIRGCGPAIHRQNAWWVGGRGPDHVDPLRGEATGGAAQPRGGGGAAPDLDRGGDRCVRDRSGGD